MAESNQDDSAASVKDEAIGLAEAIAGIPIGRRVVFMLEEREEVPPTTDSAAREAIHDSGVLFGRPYGLAHGPAPSPYSRQDWMVKTEAVDDEVVKIACEAIEEAVKKGVTEGCVMIRTSTETGMMEVDCIMGVEALVTLRLTLLVMVRVELGRKQMC